MTETTSPIAGDLVDATPSTPPTPSSRHRAELDVAAQRQAERMDRLFERRSSLKSRHAHGLSRLMEERSDLRGVHALADLVDDAVRWTA